MHHRLTRPDGASGRVVEVVADGLWTAAHARQTAARAIYLKGTQRRPFGRPALGSPARYQLTGLAQCGGCGNTLIVTGRSHGATRAFFYACAGHHQRGPTVCDNARVLPMTDGNEILVETLLDDLLDESMLIEATAAAFERLNGDDTSERLRRLELPLAKVERECHRLVTAIAAGGQLTGLLDALQARERERTRLQAERAAVCTPASFTPRDAERVRGELLSLAASWRHVLADDPTHARPIVSALLKGRVTITPTRAQARMWTLSGEGTLVGLFERVVSELSRGGTSLVPAGWNHVATWLRTMDEFRSEECGLTVVNRPWQKSRAARHGRIGHRATATQKNLKNSLCLCLSVASFSVSRGPAVSPRASSGFSSRDSVADNVRLADQSVFKAILAGRSMESTGVTPQPCAGVHGRLVDLGFRLPRCDDLLTR
jgi:hypothetical protein